MKAEYIKAGMLLEVYDAFHNMCVTYPDSLITAIQGKQLIALPRGSMVIASGDTYANRVEILSGKGIRWIYEGYLRYPGESEWTAINTNTGSKWMKLGI